MSVSDYTISDARSYGFGLLELYKIWHWNNCFPHSPSHDKIDEMVRAAQQELDERYQLLPLDAEGEVIHVGDEMTVDGRSNTFTVDGIGLLGGHGVGVVYYTTDGGLCNGHLASDCRHYRKPTIEDVLGEFAIACEDAGNAGPAVVALIYEYAKRIREAE